MTDPDRELAEKIAAAVRQCLYRWRWLQAGDGTEEIILPLLREDREERDRELIDTRAVGNGYREDAKRWQARAEKAEATLAAMEREHANDWDAQQTLLERARAALAEMRQTREIVSRDMNDVIEALGDWLKNKSSPADAIHNIRQAAESHADNSAKLEAALAAANEACGDWIKNKSSLADAIRNIRQAAETEADNAARLESALAAMTAERDRNYVDMRRLLIDADRALAASEARVNELERALAESGGFLAQPSPAPEERKDPLGDCLCAVGWRHCPIHQEEGKVETPSAGWEPISPNARAAEQTMQDYARKFASSERHAFVGHMPESYCDLEPGACHWMTCGKPESDPVHAEPNELQARYAAMGEAPWFKAAHEGKSLGEPERGSVTEEPCGYWQNTMLGVKECNLPRDHDGLHVLTSDSAPAPEKQEEPPRCANPECEAFGEPTPHGDYASPAPEDAEKLLEECEEVLSSMGHSEPNDDPMMDDCGRCDLLARLAARRQGGK